MHTTQCYQPLRNDYRAGHFQLFILNGSNISWPIETSFWFHYLSLLRGFGNTCFGSSANTDLSKSMCGTTYSTSNYAVAHSYWMERHIMIYNIAWSAIGVNVSLRKSFFAREDHEPCLTNVSSFWFVSLTFQNKPCVHNAVVWKGLKSSNSPIFVASWSFS